MSPLEALGWGALGAAGVHMLPLMRQPTPSRRSALLAQGATWVDYWLAFIVRVAIGAGITAAFAHDVSDMTPLLAINVGAAWPVLLRGFNRAAPQLPPGHTS
jgi:hypothetical protein